MQTNNILIEVASYAFLDVKSREMIGGDALTLQASTLKVLS